MGTDPNLNATKDSYSDNYGAFGTAEIGAETVRLRQRIYNIPPGLYAIKAQCITVGAEKSNTYLYAAEEATIEKTVPFDILEGDELTTYNNLVAHHRAEVEKVNGTFRYNAPVGDFLAGGKATNADGTGYTCGDKYEPDESFHEKTIYLYVKPMEKDTEVIDLTNGTSTTRIVEKGKGFLAYGFYKTALDGRSFLDNVKLYYYGPEEFGLDAFNTINEQPEAFTTRAYPNPHRFNFTRSLYPFTSASADVAEGEGAWNSVVLPVSLTGNNLISAFGENVKLSKLKGINPDLPSQIVFEPVPVLEMNDNIALEAGEVYALWTDRKPTWYTSDNKYNYTMDLQNGTIIDTYGPIYHIDGVNRPDTDSFFTLINSSDYDASSRKFTKIYATGNNGEYKLKATGYFAKPDYAPAHSYVLTGGKMYYLSGNWTPMPGSSWYLEDVDGTPLMNFSFLESETTDIEEISTDADGSLATKATGIYNLNGQKISDNASTAGLAKGIYISGGKKIVVK